MSVGGALRLDELQSSPGYPSLARQRRGPVAVIECVEAIPCNPCEAACEAGAIIVGEEISNLPRIDEEKCTGCGRCVRRCPGLAIFVVQIGSPPGRATITLPFELPGVPDPGETVTGLDREGRAICGAEVLRVSRGFAAGETTLVTLAAPEAYGELLRAFRRREQ